MKQLSNIIICLLLSMSTAFAAAQEWVSGGLRYQVVGDGEAAVAPWVEAGRSLYADVVIVPETVHYDGLNYRVTAVADSAFYNSLVTELQLPNTVRRIGRWAMANAFELTSVTLPLHLQQVSRGMLAGTDLTSIIIPEGVTRIDASAFEDCYRLHTVYLPSTLVEIGDYAFDGCHGLMEVYSAAAEPPVWLGHDALPAINGTDLVLVDDRAAQAWRDHELWGDHHRFTLWIDEGLTPSFAIENMAWGDHWSQVELGRRLAYRIYGEDGYLMALTTADHYYLPMSDHQADYVVVPSTSLNDSEQVQAIGVCAPLAAADELASELTHPRIYAIDGVLHIDGDNHGTWTIIHDMYGRLYYKRPSNDGQVITLARNRVYIVAVGNYVKKVFL